MDSGVAAPTRISRACCRAGSTHSTPPRDGARHNRRRSLRNTRPASKPTSPIRRPAARASVTYTCASPGMPRVINGYGPTEFVVTPGATHILVENIQDSRRIFTDGRDWPKEIMPSLIGYSIGRWIDADGDGKYDVLEVETRGFRGPRAFDASGIPLHDDNQTIVKERIYLDKNNRNLLLDDVTVIDHALTHPWTVLKRYRREPGTRPVWTESICAESNNHVRIGNENYMLSGDGYLMPTKKGQRPPDLNHFTTSGK